MNSVHYDGALDALETALIWQSNRENTLRVLFKLHLNMGRAREAAESVERMLALDPTNYKMYYVLGQIYALQQDRTRSYQAYQSVLHLVSNSGEAEKVRALLR
jgi:tetratricopeptide (TPR) repeat protein|tara:strand:+ start:36 stop:344 length:309 start_codon:yes stop_codon:yes gene_type:complete